MTTIQALYEDYSPLVARIAKREHKGAVSCHVDDVEQAVWLFMFENVQHLAGYTEPGIRDLATKSARKYLLKERIDYMHFRGNFIYTPEIVETYLKDAIWSQIEDVPDIDGRVDVTDAYNRLPLLQRQLLFRKYALGEPPVAADKAARRMIERALVYITNGLNLKLHQTKVDDENV